MAIQPYETSELLGVVENLEPLNTYWLDLFFPRVFTSDSEWIDLDLVDRGKRLAPFVAPNNQGQPMVSRREYTRRFKPAYIKPKDPVDPARVLVRRAGEGWGGTLSPQQREDAIVADYLDEHRTSIIRRWDWMAAEAIKFGQVTVEGENYPSRTVFFGRAATHTIALSGAARWNQGTSDPIADLTAWAQLMHRSGRPASRLTMGLNAAASFFGHAKVQALLETRRGSTFAVESKIVTGETSVYHGQLPGSSIGIYTYNDTWEDNDGNEQIFLDPNALVLTGDPEGVRCFGAIMDSKAQYNSLPMFPKMWYQEDPSGLFVMTQSAPLMVPTRPNSSMYVTVQ